MIACFDIGGSAIKAAYAETPEQVVTLSREATPLQSFDEFVSVMGKAIHALPQKPTRAAVSITGVIDPDTQRITCANIPCIDDRRLSADLAERLGLPVLIANDADCFALAEAGLGAGRGHRIVLGAIFGTGIGGGLVVDGHLINAHGGFAGEWGHGPAVALRAGNPPVEIPHFDCGCGQRGCVDSVGAARGMERLHKLLHDVSLTSAEITSRWVEGDADAGRTIDVLVDLVSSPLALTINITGATIVPVGGGLSNVPALIETIDRTVRTRTLRRFERPLVVPGELRIEPGLIGAALLGLQAEGDTR
ncbi:N-acetylglucosamine kinase [Pararhizobium capsulatum DSM 1112]|uniref:N-acetylglucosamine kinase n=1 Tax=Pararhizobium capsulatum DSM 1112 TaxID=1121113 RepID=A0ABU0BKQ1_9HYPH|nr:ROK family protein [Pararhizobium capsulatum]MDQ0318309.1 N-acetylglucosamine kinase [Pararhizobium capsulatum DSM 1112]